MDALKINEQKLSKKRTLKSEQKGTEKLLYTFSPLSLFGQWYVITVCIDLLSKRYSVLPTITRESSASSSLTSTKQMRTGVTTPSP